MADAPVLFDLLPAKGKHIGVATLNSEKTLNSLSLPMIDLLTAKLNEWRSDDAIAMVMLQGKGDRAFSAGGDIQDLYRSMCEHPGGPNPYADAFFEREYRLDHLIHTYPKPILVWAHGFVMGGGLGVMAGCSHRLGTEQSRIAMPEITIGLFPDAGATWFLARMPTHLAHFLAWTGCQLHAVDAKQVGLIDHLVSITDKDNLVAALSAADWTTDPAANRLALDAVIGSFEANVLTFPESVLALHEDLIKRMVNTSLEDACPPAMFARQLAGIDVSDNWLAKAAATFTAGCPTTAHIVVRQIKAARGLTLEQTFMLELVIAIQCSRHPDFAEGIRALLIDRDNKPGWRYPRLEDVPSHWIDAHFQLPGVHPLSDLVG